MKRFGIGLLLAAVFAMSAAADESATKWVVTRNSISGPHLAFEGQSEKEVARWLDKEGAVGLPKMFDAGYCLKTPDGSYLCSGTTEFDSWVSTNKQD